uniref:Variant surface glycoprotein 1125.1639 n=1 Tax=Trypanosoma brucei TaxID=5691 RepID=A0A1J0R7Q4_9TRYP|nr:variant surface glycoprotein 1125.1639 [Trypanosoma brucei]
MFLILTIAALFSTLGGETASENAREFTDMCTMYKLLTRPMPLQQIEEGTAGDQKKSTKSKVDGIVLIIRKLNLTVAEEQIDNVLKDATKYKTMVEVSADNTVKGYFDKTTEEQLTQMRTDYKDINSSGEQRTAFSRLYNTPLPEAKRKNLRHIFKVLTSQAIELQTEVATKDSRLENTMDEARRHFYKAVYGEDAATALTTMPPLDAKLPEPAESVFPWDDNSNRNSVCKEAGEAKNKAGKALATDMLCLCLKQQSNGHEQCTGTDLDGSTDYGQSNGMRAKAATTWKATEAACKLEPAVATVTTLATAIQAAVTEFYSRLGTNWVAQAAVNSGTGTPPKRTGFYGAFSVSGSAPTCDADHATPLGQAAKGMCIDYSSLLKPDKQIPWIKEIKLGLNKLAEASDIFHQSVSIISEAKSIEHQMETLLLMGDFLTQATGPVSTAAKNKQPPLDEQNKCKNPPNKTATGCASVGCDFDSEKKECIPKEGATPTAIGTGEGETLNAERKSAFKRKTNANAKPKMFLF